MLAVTVGAYLYFKGGDELANQEQKPSELLYLDLFLAIFQPFLRWLLTIGFLESTFHALTISFGREEKKRCGF